MRKYNCKLHKHDPRDFKFKAIAPAAPKVLPAVWDLRWKDSPVFNQGNLGSCTGNAGAAMYQYVEKIYLRRNAAPGSVPELFDKSFQPVSRLFLYYNERKIEGTVNEDAGAYVADCCKALADYGVCKEESWGYVERYVYDQPGSMAYVEAANHKISSYHKLDNTNLQELKLCLHEGYPFIFGFQVFESFESQTVALTGLMPMPVADEGVLGGHCVMAIGWDDAKQSIICKNSWGADWGDKGYFYMPYAFITDANVADDFWTMRK